MLWGQEQPANVIHKWVHLLNRGQKTFSQNEVQKHLMSSDTLGM